MRNRVLSLSIAVCLLLTIIAVGSVPTRVQAQSGNVVCDSTLITLLYAAEHDYGFHSAMDLTKFEKGQFTPLFTSMMSAGAMMGTADAMMAAATPGAMMATQNAMMSGTPDAMMTALKPGVVTGEDTACTSLRAEVEGYLLTKFTGAMH